MSYKGDLLKMSDQIYQQRTPKSVEHYTPKWIVELVRSLMGTIDLDPASSEKANEIVKARHYYTEEEDGLLQPWYGNVFCNPPGKPSKWFKKAIDEYIGEDGREDVHSVKDLFFVVYSIDRFPSLLKICKNYNLNPIIIIPHKRVEYLNCETLQPQKQPLHGSAFIYISDRQMRQLNIDEETLTVLKP